MQEKATSATSSEHQTQPLWKKTHLGYAYYHRDHLGTPILLTDKTNTKVWEARYRAFGERTLVVNAVENNLGLPGQYYDSESGLWQNWNRDYDQDTGRYIQSDPIGLDGGLNTYGYALHNPHKYIDPDGLNPAAFIGAAARICQKIPSCKKKFGDLAKKAAKLCKSK